MNGVGQRTRENSKDILSGTVWVTHKFGARSYALKKPKGCRKRSESHRTRPWSRAGERENLNLPDPHGFHLGEELPNLASIEQLRNLQSVNDPPPQRFLSKV
ncbi:hypothetical protein HispidOSU_024715 [Sigmodon hispidus]